MKLTKFKWTIQFSDIWYILSVVQLEPYLPLNHSSLLTDYSLSSFLALDILLFFPMHTSCTSPHSVSDCVSLNV